MKVLKNSLLGFALFLFFLTPFMALPQIPPDAITNNHHGLFQSSDEFRSLIQSSGNVLRRRKAPVPPTPDLQNHLWSFVPAGVTLRPGDLSENGTYIATTGFDAADNGYVYFFHYSSNVPVWTYTFSSLTYGEPRGISMANDGQYFVMYTDTGYLFLFTRTSSTPLWSDKAGQLITNAHISDDGNYIAAGSYDNKLYFYHRSSSTPLWSYTDTDDVEIVSLSSNGSLIASGGAADYVRLFSSGSSVPIWSHHKGVNPMDSTHRIDISGNGEWIVCASAQSNILSAYHYLSSSPAWNFTIGTSGSERPNDPKVSKDGTFVATGANDHYLYLLDGSLGQQLWNYTAGLTTSPDYLSMDRDCAFMLVQFTNLEGVKLFHRSSNIPIWSESGNWGYPVISRSGSHFIYTHLASPQLRLYQNFQPPGRSVEYVIISPDDAYVQAFADWKTQKGVPTIIANTTWISANIAGRDTAEKIWNYIHEQYLINYPSLQWLLLVGNNVTTPPRYVYLPDTSEVSCFSTTLKPTDFYYSVMGDPNWDDDNDGLWGESITFNIGGPSYDEIGDWQPDLYVGRIPFSDQTNITNILQRVITYESNPLSFSTTGWDSFLLSGSVSNYGEEYNYWLDNDWTDEGELSDFINDTAIPSYYDVYRYYETNFWDYTRTNPYSPLNDTAVSQAINTYSPALINLAAHGSPTGISRKYDSDGPSYGYRYDMGTLASTDITDIAIGDANWDGINDIVVTTGSANRSLIMYNGQTWLPTVIWWMAPGNYFTCVAIGDVMNNGTMSIVAGTASGGVYLFYNDIYGYWHAWILYIGPAPVTCIDTGSADNVLDEITNIMGSTIDVVWGDQNGVVRVSTVSGSPSISIAGPWTAYTSPSGHQIYSLRIGNPNDDTMNDIVIGTGYLSPSLNGDCYLLNYQIISWAVLTIETGLGGFVYGLDIGDAENDGANEVVIGLNSGALYTYEGNTFPDPSRQVVISSGGAAIYCLRIGRVDTNPTFPSNWQNSIIVGNGMSEVRKYHTSNSIPFIESYPIDFDAGFPVTALDIGQLLSTDVFEVAVGLGTGQVYFYEWDHSYTWGTLLDSTQAASSTSSIPALVYGDACSSGAFDFPGLSLAEGLLFGGSIGYVGATRISWYYLGPMTNSISAGLNRYMDWMFWSEFFNGTSNYQPGVTLYRNKVAYIARFQSQTSQSSWESSHRKNLLGYTLFGDPEVDIYTKNPRIFQTTIPVDTPPNLPYTIFVEDSFGTPVNGARVCIQAVSSGAFYQVVYTNATGHATFTPTGSIDEALTITITKHNFAAYQGTTKLAVHLDASTPSVTNNWPTSNTLDITGITVTSPYGEVNGSNAVRCTWTIFQGLSNLTYGQLSYSGGTWSVTNIPIAGLADATYYVRCYFEAYGGNGTADSTPFIKDTTPPAWNPSPTNQILEYGLMFSYDLNVTDVSSIHIWWLNDTSHFSIDSTGLITNTSALAVNTYGIQVWVNDSYTNTQTANFSVIVQDTTAPTWVITPANQQLELGDALSHQVSATDLSSIDHWTIDDTTNFAISGSGLITNALQVPAGTYILEVRAYDPYNNYCVAFFTVTVTDTVAPTWVIAPTDHTLAYGEVLDTQLAAYDLADIAQWSINDTTHFAIDSTGRITSIGTLNPGTYGLQITATDPSGNTLTATITITVQPPTLPPGIPGFPLGAIVLGLLITIIPFVLYQKKQRNLSNHSG